MVYLNEVTDLMDQMMKVEIFRPSQKLRMAKDEERTFLDPNLIMDARHKLFREDLSVSPTKCSVLKEARRLLAQEKTREFHGKREQDFVKKELKKFEKELQKSRPKFLGPYACSKRNFIRSDDEDFWSISRKFDEKKTTQNASTERKLQEGFDIVEDSSAKTRKDTEKMDLEGSMTCIGRIKVTIKDKSNIGSEAKNLNILRKYFDALRENSKEQQRFREIKRIIQERTASRIIREYFDIWRNQAKEAKTLTRKKKEQKVSVERNIRIEMFINAIAERQKELTRDRKSSSKDVNSIAGDSRDVETKRKNIYCKQIIVDPPAESRLNAQKRIIEEQRAKLAEQNRIIEELKLKQAQKEIFQSGRETINIAKETLTHCAQKTRRTLIQLMRQTGYKDESLSVSQRVPRSPKFLIRMKARAEARKERIRIAEEERRKKFEEQKKKEEASRIKEEQEKRRLQQEVLREARRARVEQERHRLREIEKSQKLNSIAKEFYRKYLSRRYLIRPLMDLVERRNVNMKKADNHFSQNLARKMFAAWKRETEEQCRIRTERAASHYNDNLISRMFEEWKKKSREENLKYQVARDFSDMKLMDKYLKIWRIEHLELRMLQERKVKLSDAHYHHKLKTRYLNAWKEYLKIAADIKESEKRRDELRQIVQNVIPDFDPKQRGVAIED